MAATQARGNQKRRDIEEFVRTYWAERNHAPTLREIGEAVGLVAPSSVHRHVQILVRAGVLAQERGVQGTIRLGRRASR